MLPVNRRCRPVPIPQACPSDPLPVLRRRPSGRPPLVHDLLHAGDARTRRRDPAARARGVRGQSRRARRRTSRWRSGPTTFGPLGRIVCDRSRSLLLFPWWGSAGNPFFLWSLMGWMLAEGSSRSAWKRSASSTRRRSWRRFRARHPVLGRGDPPERSRAAWRARARRGGGGDRVVFLDDACPATSGRRADARRRASCSSLASWNDL